MAWTFSISTVLGLCALFVAWAGFFTHQDRVMAGGLLVSITCAVIAFIAIRIYNNI